MLIYVAGMGSSLVELDGWDIDLGGWDGAEDQEELGDGLAKIMELITKKGTKGVKVSYSPKCAHLYSKHACSCMTLLVFCTDACC